jgi:hypothetical protein
MNIDDDLNEADKLLCDFSEAFVQISDGFVSSTELKRAVLQMLSERAQVDLADYVERIAEIEARSATRRHRFEETQALRLEICDRDREVCELWDRIVAEEEANSRRLWERSVAARKRLSRYLFKVFRPRACRAEQEERKAQCIAARKRLMELKEKYSSLDNSLGTR